MGVPERPTKNSQTTIFLSPRKTYLRFDNRGMTVDLLRYFRSPAGAKKAKAVADSAFKLGKLATSGK